jgi:putative ABC transport system permease protein
MNRLAIRMLLLQAAVVGAQGYAVGIGLTAVFFIYFMGTDLAFDVHWEVLLLTAAAVMLVIASAVMVSLRAVLKVQPALVFRG